MRTLALSRVPRERRHPANGETDGHNGRVEAPGRAASALVAVLTATALLGACGPLGEGIDTADPTISPDRGPTAPAPGASPATTPTVTGNDPTVPDPTTPTDPAATGPTTTPTGLPSTEPTSVPSSSPQAPVFLPEPNRWVPRRAAPLARELERVSRAVRASVDHWLDTGDPATEPAPSRLVLQALFQQRIYRFLIRRAELADEVVALLPPPIAAEAGDTIAPLARLIANVRPLPSAEGFLTGPPEPAGALLDHFREGERRFGVGWEVLAAVMYVESKFGRTRSLSSAGAQGPMQFLPSTWDAYGLGGDIDDPHDAVIGAANYLRASGAPGDLRRALFAYNRSETYVDAVLGLAELLGNEPRRYFALYNWQVFVVTTQGDVRLTGPGLE